MLIIDKVRYCSKNSKAETMSWVVRDGQHANNTDRKREQKTQNKGYY